MTKKGRKLAFLQSTLHRSLFLTRAFDEVTFFALDRRAITVQIVRRLRLLAFAHAQSDTLVAGAIAGGPLAPSLPVGRFYK